jgi:phospholipase C
MMTPSNESISDALERRLAIRQLRRRARPVGLPPEVPDDLRDSLSKITHVVVLMMENHSYDNYFGVLGRGDGFTPIEHPTNTNLTMNGTPIPVRHRPTVHQPKGLPLQTWRASHIQADDGANGGFCRSVEDFDPTADPSVPMDYWTAADLPFYHGLAGTFPLFDRWFCSCLGPTFPNRRFLVAGTANGLIDDVLLSIFDYPSGGTIFDHLTAKKITWTNYHDVSTAWAVLKRLVGKTGLGLLRAIGLLLPFVRDFIVGNLQFTAALYPMGLLRARKHLKSLEQFFIDADNGTLPHFSLVDPSFGAFSEEDPQDIQIGEGFAAEVINRVMHGKAWKHSLLIWVYDEHGGYYDHVSPPPAEEPDDRPGRSMLDSRGVVKWLLAVSGMHKKLESIDRVRADQYHYDQYGFRVPAVVVSPYAKKDWVASEVTGDVFDHTSILKLLEMRWRIPTLTCRDSQAVPPLAALDLTSSAPPFLAPPVLPSPARAWEQDRRKRKKDARLRRRRARERLRGRRGAIRPGVPW